MLPYANLNNLFLKIALLQIMDNIEIDVDVPKEATSVGPKAILIEGGLDSKTSTNPNEVHT
jgi:hypothetical protein